MSFVGIMKVINAARVSRQLRHLHTEFMPTVRNRTPKRVVFTTGVSRPLPALDALLPILFTLRV